MTKVTIAITVDTTIVGWLATEYDETPAVWKKADMSQPFNLEVLASMVQGIIAHENLNRERAIALKRDDDYKALVTASPRSIQPRYDGRYGRNESANNCSERVYAGGWGHDCSRKPKYRIVTVSATGEAIAHGQVFCKQHAEKALQQGLSVSEHKAGTTMHALALEGVNTGDFIRHGYRNMSWVNSRYSDGWQEPETNYIHSVKADVKSYEMVVKK